MITVEQAKTIANSSVELQQSDTKAYISKIILNEIERAALQNSSYVYISIKSNGLIKIKDFCEIIEDLEANGYETKFSSEKEYFTLTLYWS